jgi:hypothetical protein
VIVKIQQEWKKSKAIGVIISKWKGEGRKISEIRSSVTEKSLTKRISSKSYKILLIWSSIYLRFKMLMDTFKA